MGSEEGLEQQQALYKRTQAGRELLHPGKQNEKNLAIATVL